MADMGKKGRAGTISKPERFINSWNARRGEGCYIAKVTEEQVKRIREGRAKGIIYKQLAAQYGLSPTTVWMIVHRQTWKHV